MNSFAELFNVTTLHSSVEGCSIISHLLHVSHNQVGSRLKGKLNECNATIFSTIKELILGIFISDNRSGRA